MKSYGKAALMAGAAGLMVASIAVGQEASPVKILPGSMTRIGSVDERFQSFNMEMVEATGGRFWKPYASKPDAGPVAKGDANQPAGMAASLYQYRAPIDLSNARLRKLAAALGPAYLRVSGTWANTTYFDPNADGKALEPPAGFKGVLTGAEWKGVIDFARVANDELVSSFATGAGTRDTAGVWMPDEARKFLDFTKAAGGSIAAAEFMNEPTFAEIGGAPKGYDAAAFARDLEVFRKFAKQDAPGMLLLGPGGVMEGSRTAMPGMKLVASADIFAATGPVFDAVSYHSYGGVSSRCGGVSGSTPAAIIAVALSEESLGRADRIEQFYGGLRDRFEPGKPLWLTETAEAACGGDKWASKFLDSFRYLDQLGDLAKRGVQVQMHNTLAASDYGLLDENTYAPRPNYWAALLLRRLMGTTVLNAGLNTRPDASASKAAGLRVYAHCLRDHAGGVALLAINADQSGSQTLNVSEDAERYTLTAPDLMGAKVQLNGSDLDLAAGDSLPAIKGEKVKAGALTLAPVSITFLAFLKADNASCQ